MWVGTRRKRGWAVYILLLFAIQMLHPPIDTDTNQQTNQPLRFAGEPGHAKLSCSLIQRLPIPCALLQYIRVVGFLYLRYCCKPALLWEWFEQYMADDEPFYVQGEKYNDETTIGRWLRLLLTELEYYDTMVRPATHLLDTL